MSEYQIKPVQLCGLDIETTGINVAYNDLIQIGIVLPDGFKVVRDVRPAHEYFIEKEALEVNGFTRLRILKAPLNTKVDEELSGILGLSGYSPGSLTPVGFNVGGFDIPFIKKSLPKTAEFFSYRALDLTALAITYELITGKSYRDLKDEMHKKIAAKLGRDQRHDALYDAEAALIAVDLFKELFHVNL